MIAVVQRVNEASVTVPSAGHAAAIGRGLCVLLGVLDGDAERDAAWMARKLVNLRIFADDQGRMNRAIGEVGGDILLVSQFTLAGDCRRGNRPSFVAAAKPEVAEPLYEQVAARLREGGVTVVTGVFGGMMTVRIENDGPVTLILDSRR